MVKLKDYHGNHPLLAYRTVSTTKNPNRIEQCSVDFVHAEGVDVWNSDVVVAKTKRVVNKVVDVWNSGVVAAGKIWVAGKWIADPFGLTKGLQQLHSILVKYGEAVVKNILSLISSAHVKLMALMPTLSSIHEALVGKVPQHYSDKLAEVITQVTSVSHAVALYIKNKAEYAAVNTYEQRMKIKKMALVHLKKSFRMLHGTLKILGNKFKISPLLFGATHAKAVQDLITKFKKKGGTEDDALLALTLGRLATSIQDEEDDIKKDIIYKHEQ